jgi:hypothetical protein
VTLLLVTPVILVILPVHQLGTLWHFWKKCQLPKEICALRMLLLFEGRRTERKGSMVEREGTLLLLLLLLLLLGSDLMLCLLGLCELLMHELTSGLLWLLGQLDTVMLQLGAKQDCRVEEMHQHQQINQQGCSLATCTTSKEQECAYSMAHMLHYC